MDARIAGRRNTHPMSYYWSMVKDMDDSQKLELITLLAESVKPQMTTLPMKRYTMAELNAMLDEAEADVAAGRVTDHEELMREWEEELAREEQEELKLQMAEAI